MKKLITSITAAAVLAVAPSAGAESLFDKAKSVFNGVASYDTKIDFSEDSTGKPEAILKIAAHKANRCMGSIHSGKKEEADKRCLDFEKYTIYEGSPVQQIIYYIDTASDLDRRLINFELTIHPNPENITTIKRTIDLIQLNYSTRGAK
jgi:hypothetical protein